MKLAELLANMDKAREDKQNYIKNYKEDIKESLTLETFLLENEGKFIVTSWLDTEVLYPHDLVKFKITESTAILSVTFACIVINFPIP